MVGRTETGAVVIATIDGRRTTSVGATLVEAAKVAQALGMQDSMNLDGGGSTTMVVNGALANVPSGSSERAVGDALVYVPSPY
jgi:exopolysaccharide biosynthesis protein